MFCSKCKTEVKEGVKFCYSCGSEIHLSNGSQEETNQMTQGIKEQEEINNIEQQLKTEEHQVMSQIPGTEPEKKKWNKSTMPIAIACLLIVIIVAVAVIELPEGRGSSGAGMGISEVGFDTPEEAIIFYLEGLRDSDLDRMLSAFAIESFVENYDFEALLERMRVYIFTMEPRIPTEVNDFVDSMSLNHRIGTINSNIMIQYLTLIQVEFELFFSTRLYEPEDVRDFVQQFVADLDSPDLESIEIIGFIPPESLHDFYLDEGNQMNIERMAATFGVDEIANRVVVFQMGRHQYMLFAEVGNYDGQWHLLHFAGNVAALVGVSSEHMGLLVPEEMDWLFDDINIDDLIVPIE